MARYHPEMRRVAALTIALAGGCGFAGSASDDVAAPDAPIDAAIDARIDARPPLPPGACGASPEDALVMCHDFEEQSTTASADGSGFGNDAELVQVMPVTRLTPSGAISFAAACDGHCQVRIAESASLDIPGPMTIAMWIHPDDTPPAGERFGLLDNNAQYALFLLDDRRLTCSIYRSTQTVVTATTPPVPLGMWTQVSCVASEGSLVVYVDGAFAASASFAPFAISTNSPKGTLLAQDLNSNGSGDETLVGQLDDVRVWTRALSPSEVCVQAKLPGCF